VPTPTGSRSTRISKTSLIGASSAVGRADQDARQLADAVLAPRQVAELLKCGPLAAAHLRAHVLPTNGEPVELPSPTRRTALTYRVVLARAERRS